jgi:hypothetical protein
MLLRNNTTLLEVMMACTQNGPHCGRKETKQCPSSQISSIPCAPRWVSNILREIWCSSITTICIDTNMPSKLSRRSNKRCGNLGLGTPHNKSQERAAPTHRKKDKEKMDSLKRTNPSCKQRRTLERQRKILGSGATSIRAPGITMLIYAQSIRWWLR